MNPGDDVFLEEIACAMRISLDTPWGEVDTFVWHQLPMLSLMWKDVLPYVRKYSKGFFDDVWQEIQHYDVINEHTDLRSVNKAVKRFGSSIVRVYFLRMCELLGMIEDNDYGVYEVQQDWTWPS